MVVGAYICAEKQVSLRKLGKLEACKAERKQKGQQSWLVNNKGLSLYQLEQLMAFLTAPDLPCLFILSVQYKTLISKYIQISNVNVGNKLKDCLPSWVESVVVR